MNYPTHEEYAATFGEYEELEAETVETTGAVETAAEERGEIAEPVENAEDAKTAAVAEGGAKPATQPAPLSAEERHRQAAARRAREQQAAEAATQARVDQVYANMFRGQVNPFTGKPITTEADFLAYQQAKQQQDTNAAMQKAGINPQVITQMVQQELQPMRQQLQEAQMQKARLEAAEFNRRADALIGEAVKSIGAQYDHSIKSLGDITAMPTAERFNELVQRGYKLEDAFYHANREAIDKRRAEAAYRKGAEAGVSRQHLSPAKQTQGKEPVSVPADVARGFREVMPGMTNAEIAAEYAACLKCIT